MNSYKIEYQSIGGSNLLAKIKDYISNHKIVMIILLALFLYFWQTHSIEKFQGACDDLNMTDCNDASQCEWKLDPMDNIKKCFLKEEGSGDGTPSPECVNFTNQEDCQSHSCEWNSFMNKCFPRMG